MITYRESDGLIAEVLSVLFPPKMPMFHPEEFASSAEYYTRMGRTPKATHIDGGPAAVIAIGTAQPKRVFALPGRVV